MQQEFQSALVETVSVLNIHSAHVQPLSLSLEAEAEKPNSLGGRRMHDLDLLRCQCKDRCAMDAGE